MTARFGMVNSLSLAEALTPPLFQKSHARIHVGSYEFVGLRKV